MGTNPRTKVLNLTKVKSNLRGAKLLERIVALANSAKRKVQANANPIANRSSPTPTTASTIQTRQTTKHYRALKQNLTSRKPSKKRKTQGRPSPPKSHKNSNLKHL